MIEGVVTDVRHAFRFLGRRPGFALVAVVTIAVGIGSLTVAFTAINAVFYRGPLDLGSPATLALIAVVLWLVVLVAAVVPGRRGARVSPLEALRSE